MLQAAAKGPLLAVLYERVGKGLPLHVAWVVNTPGAQRLNVVDHVAGAGSPTLASRGAGRLPLELEDCGSGPVIFSEGRPCQT